MEFEHKPVLLNETIDNLHVKPEGTYVDGTLGGGGHAYEVAKRLSPQGRFIGIDQDADAIRAAGQKLAEFGNVTLIRSNYCSIREELMGNNVTGVDGIVLDLGVSSYQLDTPQRGFSYMSDAPLDMRMDQRNDLTAGDIINGYSEAELYRVIRDYGEDRFAKNIAKHIVKAREQKPIETTFELNEIIRAAIPAKVRETGGHPSKRTFQALRIAVNGELERLPEALNNALKVLNPGGRIGVITFHSLEDRIVKNFFRDKEKDCICPDSAPRCTCGRNHRMVNIITKKPVSPSEAEIKENAASRSSKLRVAEKVAV